MPRGTEITTWITPQRSCMDLPHPLLDPSLGDGIGSVRAADAIDGVGDEGRSSKGINPRRPCTDPPHHRREQTL